jgi:hypothetical protein
MLNFKRVSLFMLFIVALLWLIAPALAQDSSPAIIVLPEGTPSFEVAAEGIIAIVYTVISQPFLAPLVVLLVAVSKRAAFLKRFSDQSLNFVWSAILFGAWVFATKLGIAAQFETGIAALTALLTTVGTYVLGLTLTSVSSSKFYQQAKAQGVAVLGYSRSSVVSAAKPTHIAEAFTDGDLRSNG